MSDLADDSGRHAERIRRIPPDQLRRGSECEEQRGWAPFRLPAVGVYTQCHTIHATMGFLKLMTHHSMGIGSVGIVVEETHDNDGESLDGYSLHLNALGKAGN